MLFDRAAAVQEPAAEPRPATVMGRTLVFDWANERYYMNNGSPAEAEGTAAVKAWLRQWIRVRLGRYPIYPSNYGSSAMDLIGKRIPRGFGLSELRRELVESATYCPAIRDVSSFYYDGSEISCTLTLQDGNQEVVTFELDP